MSWEAPRTWVTGEPFPHSRNRLDTAGKGIRHAVRDGLDISEGDRQVVEDFRRWYLPCNEALHGTLSAAFYEHGEIDQEAVPITSRHKTPESIVSKLCRSSTALSRMQDIAGARIVVPGVVAQEAAIVLVTACLEERWHLRTEDMREEPTNFGYRAVHVIAHREEEGRRQFGEVQIRTGRQEVWAQMVERLDKDFDYDLKHGRGRAEWLEWLQDLSDELRKADLGQPAIMPPAPLDLEINE
jgi:ppGpp synthetase/RelA/SpoT-type nucleotidyltranferase